MKPVLWMKSSCTTCRKAKALLAELGVEVTIRDYWKQPLAAAELESLLPADPTPFLGSRKGVGRRLGKPEAIVLMVEDNNLLKRPVLVHGEGVIIGFDEAAYRAMER